MPPKLDRQRGAVGKPVDLDRLPDARLVRLVRDALSYVHDPAYLETHPLAHLAAAATGHRDEHRGKALRRLLLACVDDLRPGGNIITSRRHQVLALHYVDRLPSHEVQRRLAVCGTTYHSAHEAGLAGVASMLRQRWAAS